AAALPEYLGSRGLRLCSELRPALTMNIALKRCEAFRTSKAWSNCRRKVGQGEQKAEKVAKE
ncbi:MAG: hypothetical protein QOH96_1059, partial [Blastocatellia bacterium]|nr:hypothetical protein [Blastocatellia bacterium]